METKMLSRALTAGVSCLALCTVGVSGVSAVPVAGGTLDPLTIPKYVTPLVIPPVMKNNGTAGTYDIAVRQFSQQILPGGIWNTLNGRTDAFPATTVWSYGPAADSAQITAPDPASQFNYPAYTIENRVNQQTSVNWINDLKDPATGNFLPHLLPVDQTLHWANPGADCIMNTGMGMGGKRTDCRGQSQDKYMGPVPIVTHVHGAHTGPESDGYPEAWWLPDPAGSNFSCVEDPAMADPMNHVYVCQGSRANKYGYAPNTNVTPGVANFVYPNDQPSTTLWYHDHGLGITRNNVYAGPAGFWLIREAGSGETGLAANSILPGPAPAAGQGVLALNVPGDPVRNSIREISIAIQDRSFNADGSLFYPANRAFFEGLGDGSVPSTAGNGAAGLDIPFIPGDARGPSDISPIWNPEAFFNVMVVNGVSWPKLEVAPALYRFRLLNGCNSRFLNLALKNGAMTKDIPFYQIGTEQSLMPQVVRVETGFATPLPGNGQDVCRGQAGKKGNMKANCVQPQAAADPQQALLMGLAERADVLVDFRGMVDGDIVRMINTAPDAPFGGFPDIPADPATTGQVMQFVVKTALLGASPTDPVLADGATPNPNAATPPASLGLTTVEAVTGYPANIGGTSVTRDLALIEEESQQACVTVDPTGAITYIDLDDVSFDPLDMMDNPCLAAGGVPFAPKAAVLGIDGSLGMPTSTDPMMNTGAKPTLWMDPIATNPALGATEAWELWNHTMDAHPIHLHLVKFKVLERRGVDGMPSIIPGNGVQPWENGWKDTVIAYPGEVTTVAATFDIPGLYVWHCHIVEHEDNEMMVPYCVGDPNANGCEGL
ncbi:MAG: multicopper oxidase family protein [Desulfobulbaceae bacterium]